MQHPKPKISTIIYTNSYAQKVPPPPSVGKTSIDPPPKKFFERHFPTKKFHRPTRQGPKM
jgi:hypothetical protein